MKTTNLFSRFSAAALFVAASLLPAALSSCSSEAEPNIPDQEQQVPEGHSLVKLALSTPSVVSSHNTRAYQVTNAEAKINSLWLFIYYADSSKDNDGQLSKAIDVKDKFEANNTPANGIARPNAYSDIYKSGDALPIVSGKYKFFLVANIDAFLSDEDKSAWKPNSSESVASPDDCDIDAFKDLVLTFGNNASKILGLTEALPMAADCTDVTATQSGKVSSGVVDCTEGTVDLKIDMHFLCSGVRFTLLFDNTKGDTPGEATFYKNFEMGETPLQVKNLLTGYDIYGEKEKLESTTTGAVTTYQDVSQGAKYTFTGTTQSFIDAPTTLTSTSNWGTDVTKRAYQAIFYLPENYATTHPLMTTLKVSYKVDNEEKTPELVLPVAKLYDADGTVTPTNDGDNVLSRANFYDVTARVTSAGMEFYVAVNKWNKHTIPGIEF